MERSPVIYDGKSSLGGIREMVSSTNGANIITLSNDLTAKEDL